MKTLIEEYLEKQKACGLKVGDKVKVLRKAEDDENGWEAWWLPEMDNFIGNTFEIIDECKAEGFVLIDNYTKENFSFPYFVLEKAEKEIFFSEWVECNLTWSHAYDEETEEENCFYYSEFRKAGTQIEYLDEDGEIQQVLIGHINKNGGRCDCCRSIKYDTVILRYRYLINF